MEEIIKRLEIAVDFLKEGLPFKVGDLYLGLDAEKYLNVTAASRTPVLADITKTSALEEITDIKRIFFEMIRLSRKFEEFVRDKKVKYNLDYDYGMGDVRVCSEKDGVVVWQTKLNDNL